MMRFILLAVTGCLATSEVAWSADLTKILSPAAKAITATGAKPYGAEASSTSRQTSNSTDSGKNSPDLTGSETTSGDTQ